MWAVASTGAFKHTALNVAKLGSRGISSAVKLCRSFKVQDDKDFSEKVENSKEPVIVDFFAT